MQSLEDIKAEAAAAIEAAADVAALEELRVSYLGKKGALTSLLKGLGQLSSEERPKAGAEINAVKQMLNEQLNARKNLASFSRTRALAPRFDERSACAPLMTRHS